MALMGASGGSGSDGPPPEAAGPAGFGGAGGGETWGGRGLYGPGISILGSRLPLRGSEPPAKFSGLIGIAGPAEEPGSGNGIGEVMTGRSPEPVSGAPGGEIGTGGSTDGRNPLSPPPGMFGR